MASKPVKDYKKPVWDPKRRQPVRNPGLILNETLNLFSTWSSGNFIRPPQTVDADGKKQYGSIVQWQIVERLFGLSTEHSTRELVFTLQLIIGSAAIPTLPDAPEPKDLDGMLRHMLVYYGALVFYATAKGNSISDDDILERVAEAGLFDDIDSEELMYYINEGRNQFEAIQNEIAKKEGPRNRKNINYRWFNLSDTFKTYKKGNQEVMKRVMPFIEICVAVLRAKGITIPNHLPFHVKADGTIRYDKHFALHMFHAPRMAVPYVPQKEQMIQACLAIQMRKVFDRREGEVHEILNYHAMLDALAGLTMDPKQANKMVRMFLLKKWNINIKGRDIKPTIFFMTELALTETTYIGDMTRLFMEYHLETIRASICTPTTFVQFQDEDGEVWTNLAPDVYRWSRVLPIIHPHWGACPMPGQQIVDMINTIQYLKATYYDRKSPFEGKDDRQEMMIIDVDFRSFLWAYQFGLLDYGTDLVNPDSAVEVLRAFSDALNVAIQWFLFTWAGITPNPLMSLTDNEIAFMNFTQPDWAQVKEPVQHRAPAQKAPTKKQPVVGKKKSVTKYGIRTSTGGHQRTAPKNGRASPPKKPVYDKNKNAGPRGRRRNGQGATSRGEDQRQPQSKPAPKQKGTDFLRKGRPTKSRGKSASKIRRVAFNDVSAMGFASNQMAVQATGNIDGDFM